MIKRNADSKTKIVVGILMLVLVIIYCSDRIINHLTLRFFDWGCWTVMVITGIILIVQGIQLNKK
jgi:hypothetical protein